ncbi:MAG: hypothetical protein F4Y80_05110 [Caldilineaceae bacterium SB0665_bin_21]|nr:hypothetical protein [Caldilineaceae bacterium SB0665_bin_21]
MPQRTLRPNRDVLNDALDTYRDTMRELIMTTCQREAIQSFLDKFNDKVGETDTSGTVDTMDRIDIVHFQYIVTQFWNSGIKLRFIDNLDSLTPKLDTLRQARNKAAHPPKGDLNQALVKHALDTILSVLQMIQDEEAKEEITSILEHWQHGGYDGIGQLTPINGLRLAAGAQVTWDLLEHFEMANSSDLHFSWHSNDNKVARAEIKDSKLTVTGCGRGTTSIDIWAIPPNSVMRSIGFCVTVPNQSPRLVSRFYDLTVSQEAHVSMDLTNAFHDPDGDNLLFSAISSHPSVLTAKVDDAKLTLTGKSHGTTSVTVTASDPDEATDSVEFTVLVPERSPRFSALFQDLPLAAKAHITLNLLDYFKPAQVDDIKFLVESSYKEVATVEVEASELTITGIGRGTSTINVTAFLPNQHYITNEFTVTVPNQQPLCVAPIYNESVQAGTSLSLNLSRHFTDPDRDHLSYTAFTNHSNVVTVQVVDTELIISGISRGTATILVDASDPDGASVTETFQVAVPNRPPCVTTPINSVAVQVGTNKIVDLSEHFSDSDDDELRFTASVDEETVAIVSIVKTQLSILGSKAGDVDIEVVATDSMGASEQTSFVVHVAKPLSLFQKISEYIKRPLH